MDTISGGDTAWILTSTALVLFMTIPGLSLFYGGLVRTKNVLSVLVQCLVLTCAMSVIWLVIGYSLAFDSTGMEEGVVALWSARRQACAAEGGLHAEDLRLRRSPEDAVGEGSDSDARHV